MLGGDCHASCTSGRNPFYGCHAGIRLENINIVNLSGTATKSCSHTVSGIFDRTRYCSQNTAYQGYRLAHKLRGATLQSDLSQDDMRLWGTKYERMLQLI